MGSHQTTMIKYLLFLGLVSAAPRPDGPPVYVPSEPYKAAPPPPRAYKPAPAPYKEEELPPQPYEYKYGVADDYSKSTYDKAETQDEYGNVQGSYKINLPDGRVQIVNYVSDKDGFRADVNYEGTPCSLTRLQVVTAPTRVLVPTQGPSQEDTTPPLLSRHTRPKIYINLLLLILFAL